MSVLGKRGIALFIYNNACKISFAVSLAAAYLLVPHQVIGTHFALSLAFALSFALTMACVAYAMRENLKKARSEGILSIVASGIGFVALEACGLSLACGTAGMGLLLLILPAALVGFLSQYGSYIVMASIALQLFSLYAMGCLKKKTLEAIAGS